MRCRIAVAGVFAAGVCLFATSAAADPGVPNTVPAGGNIPGVPGRTAISLRVDFLGLRWGTANDTQPRPGLSMVKLYISDYALHHGDGSAQDRQLGERMIRYSDDSAANALAAKYPNAIDAIAAEYGLPATRAGDTWGSSYTSTADLTKFLDRKVTTDPASPILCWMAEANRVAADGTVQDWGTGRLPVVGSKWGWSDDGPQDVASASYGPGFTIAAHTHGSPAEQTADVLGALPGMVLGVPAQWALPSIGPRP